MADGKAPPGKASGKQAAWPPPHSSPPPPPSQLLQLPTNDEMMAHATSGVPINIEPANMASGKQQQDRDRKGSPQTRHSAGLMLARDNVVMAGRVMSPAKATTAVATDPIESADCSMSTGPTASLGLLVARDLSMTDEIHHHHQQRQQGNGSRGSTSDKLWQDNNLSLAKTARVAASTPTDGGHSSLDREQMLAESRVATDSSRGERLQNRRRQPLQRNESSKLDNHRHHERLESHVECDSETRGRKLGDDDNNREDDNNNHNEGNSGVGNNNHNNVAPTQTGTPQAQQPARAVAHFSMSDSGIGSAGSQLTSCPDHLNRQQQQQQQQRTNSPQHQFQTIDQALERDEFNNLNAAALSAASDGQALGPQMTSDEITRGGGCSEAATMIEKQSQSKMANEPGNTLVVSSIVGAEAGGGQVVVGNLANASRSFSALDELTRHCPTSIMNNKQDKPGYDCQRDKDSGRLKQQQRRAIDDYEQTGEMGARRGEPTPAAATSSSAAQDGGADSRLRQRIGRSCAETSPSSASSSTLNDNDHDRGEATAAMVDHHHYQQQHQQGHLLSGDSFRSGAGDRHSSGRHSSGDRTAAMSRVPRLPRQQRQHQFDDSLQDNGDDDCKFMEAGSQKRTVSAQSSSSSSLSSPVHQAHPPTIDPDSHHHHQVIPRDQLNAAISPRSATPQSHAPSTINHAATNPITEEPDDTSGMRCYSGAKMGISEHVTRQQQQPHKHGQQAQPKSYWNYGQLVTSITDQTYIRGNYNNNKSSGALMDPRTVSGGNSLYGASQARPQAQPQTLHQQQSEAASNYFGPRRPPKRLVYFYDINDDVDDEINFLTESLDTKSYAISMIGQHDHYLENIAKSQAAAARIKAINGQQQQQQQSRQRNKKQTTVQQQQSQCKVNAYKAEQTMKSFELGGGGGGGVDYSETSQRGSSSINLPSPRDDSRHLATNKQLFSQLKRPSFQAAFFPLSSGASLASGGSATNNAHGRNQTAASQPQTCTIELPLSPHWSSMPSHLNKTGIAMMRCYQSSLASNLFKGRRERALLNERGHFDRSCCRVDYDSYAKAVNTFMSEDGQPMSFDVSERQTISPSGPLETGSGDGTAENKKQHCKIRRHRASEELPISNINLGVIHEPFKSLRPGDGGLGLGQGGRNRFLSMSHIQQLTSKQSRPTNQHTSLDAVTTTSQRGSLASSKQPSDRSKALQPPTTATTTTTSLLNSKQRSLLISLERYALAMARYEMRREQLRRSRANECNAGLFGVSIGVGGGGQGSQSNLNRTTQALRRGSAVVLSKLKLLHSTTGHLPSNGSAPNNGAIEPALAINNEDLTTTATTTTRAHNGETGQVLVKQRNNVCSFGDIPGVTSTLATSGFNRAPNVPRLSLTKADSLRDSMNKTSFGAGGDDGLQGEMDENQNASIQNIAPSDASMQGTSCSMAPVELTISAKDTNDNHHHHRHEQLGQEDRVGVSHHSIHSVAQVSEVAIPMVGDSNDSLTPEYLGAASSSVGIPMVHHHQPEHQQTEHAPVTSTAGFGRHSIANLPSGGSFGLTIEGGRHPGDLQATSANILASAAYQNTFSGSSLGVTDRRPVSANASAGETPRKVRKSIISEWFTVKRPATAQGAMTGPRQQFLTSDQHQQQPRDSCFSDASKSTSDSTDRCSQLLRPNLRRRRSFSGPLEWLERDEHRSGLMLLETGASTTKRASSKKRTKKMKPQKSNSSDYHSLNNRRVYKLDSRGFQTKLKGTFYVITNDPLITSQQQQQQQAQFGSDNMTIASYGYDWAHQAPPPPQPMQAQRAPLEGLDGQQLSVIDRDTMSSNELESSFFNTSIDDPNNSSAAGDAPPSSRGTPASRLMVQASRGQLHNHHQQQKRTFFVYFHWTQWMIQRRHYSLFLFSPKSRIRRFCLAVTNRKEFDYFVLFFISMNCVTLAMERPRIPPWSKEREFLTLANYYFTFMFTLEMLLKVIAKGLYYGKDAYLSDSWNIMDGALVGFSLFDVLLSIVADRSPRIFAILRVFRLLRSLRPLRVINRLMGLKLVVQTLLLSLRPIGNIVLICCTFFIIFGILGVQLFKGTFYYCDGPDPLEIMRTVRTKEDCLIDHRNRWINRKYNFDNLGQALMALFVLSSKDGWVNIMYTGIDAVGVDMQPRENYNEWRLLYFISFLLLVAFFVLNMFVGVVVENFHRCRKEQELEEKARRAEKRQRKLDKRRRQLREPPYYANYGKFRLLLHKWVTGGYFDLLIAAVIGFNVVFMSLEHYQMPPNLIHLLKVSNYFFTAAFIIEAAIKTSALGMRRYLKDRWNQLDVSIVAMSIIGILFEEMDSFTLPINPTLLRVLRVMRIARVLKLLKMAKGIRALLDTVMQALPQVGNLGLLFFLLFFIFAALGVELFGRLECNDEYPCSGLMDQHAHFQNFGLAFLTLFRVATGDNWNGIMKDTLRDKCDPSSDCLRNCCVSQIIAPLYFVVFVLLAQFVLVNVVVAVLMKHLEESHHEMEIDEEYELDKQLAEELEAKKRALLEARERQSLYWI